MARAQATRRWAARQEWNPLRALFRLFTSVRFAILLVLVVACASLLGVIFPQVPESVRINPPAYDAWVETQRGLYGTFTEPMRRLGLFEVFRTPWFNGIFVVLIAAVSVCTYNRFAPTWRTVRRPLRRVNDRYFERAHARAAVEMPADPAAVERALRAARYKVERVEERDGAVYLFGDKYPWVQLATFVTHLSLILFLAGGIVTKLVGFETFIEVGEGTTAPVFPVVHPDQMQVQNLNSFEGRDAQGRVIDYYTELAIYKDGKEICRGKTTVNDPLGCAGYRFHQTTFSPDGVGLKVRDVQTGAVVYAEAPVLQRESAAPSPRFVVRDAKGQILFDDFLVLRPLDDRRTIALVPVPGIEKVLPVVLFTEAGGSWKLSVVHLADRSDPTDRDYQITLNQGESATDGGLTFAFAELRGLPSLIVQDIPGIAPVAYLQLERQADGALVLNVMNVARPESPTSWLSLRQGEPQVAGDYEYTFEGPREYTGMLVKRDPGSWLIWTATTLLIVGLAVTFYVPRRRVWVKIMPERTLIAGIAERMAHLSPELQRLLERAQRESRSAGPAGP